MEQVFSYIIGLGAAVMMPIIFTVLGVCIGIKLGDALKSGLKVGVGFIGLSIVTALLTSALGPALNTVVDIYDLQLKVFDMGWPAAAAVAYNTARRCIHNTGMPWCKPAYAGNKNHTHRKYRPVELLALCLHWRGYLFCISVAGMGFLWSNHMLYNHPCTG